MISPFVHSIITHITKKINTKNSLNSRFYVNLVQNYAK